MTAPSHPEAPSARQTDDVAWQRLWLAARRHPWRTLALIPASRGIETKRLAEALAAVGERHLGQPVHVTDATDLSIERLSEVTRATLAHAERNTCALIALSPLADNPPSAELARVADAAILCVALGETGITEARAAIAEVGAARFLGSVVVHRRDKRS